ncbi:hypothetical protein I316_05675 [Kwoniella heveanensis BCC8398]|uniref:Uncharacterized protein n=1 Tax=Kwoniella heveanensis BCC8398 TaxID=1296120 RepID=A0A1B9GNR6_9TREE|nr:hypothetical protein I316_05675 [Kwoniella heveanensis BCC8398]
MRMTNDKFEEERMELSNGERLRRGMGIKRQGPKAKRGEAVVKRASCTPTTTTVQQIETDTITFTPTMYFGATTICAYSLPITATVTSTATVEASTITVYPTETAAIITSTVTSIPRITRTVTATSTAYTAKCSALIGVGLG